MPDFPLHSTPTTASAANGIVMLDGPNGLAVSLTADAAAESAVRIARAAEEARTQAQMAERDGPA